MKKLIPFLLSLCMLFSLCGCAGDGGRPWLCVDLAGAVTEEISAPATENYALFANKDYYVNAVIPQGYNRTGTVADLDMICTNDVLALFEDPDSVPEKYRPLIEFYLMQLDWDSRNAIGVAPLKHEIDLMEKATNIDEYNTYLKETSLEDTIIGPFDVAVSPSQNDSDKYVAYASSPALILGDSAEYKTRTELGQKKYDAYKKLVTGMFVKLGFSEEESVRKYENAIALEGMMAPYIYTNEETLQSDFSVKSNNSYTRDGMLELQGKIPAVEYLEDVNGYGRQEEWIVVNPNYFKAMADIYTDENVEKIIDWAESRTMINQAGFFDRESYDLSCEAERAITGAETRSDEVIAVSNTKLYFPWLVAEMYCEKYFTDSDRAAVEDLIQKTMSVYEQIISDADFISAETKAKALDKLRSMKYRCLYPDDWDKYISDTLRYPSIEEGGSYWDAVVAISVDAVRRQAELAKHPVDKSSWEGLVPTTANCFYNFKDNTINILAAFCRGDVYKSGMSTEELFGKLAVVIGHEISHAFDGTGAQYDKNGNMNDWWTEEDNAAFNEKLAEAGKYLDAIEPWKGIKLNGSTMTNELSADMGGMKAALLMAQREADFDYDLFFRSYAQLWAAKESRDRILWRLTDSHPPCYVRINAVLQQFDEFINCYGIKKGDGMYLAADKRINVW